MTNMKNPIIKIRDGSMAATVWENIGKDGKIFLSVRVTRSYQDADNNWQESDRFSGNELLRAARLFEQAYTAQLERRQAKPEAA